MSVGWGNQNFGMGRDNPLIGRQPLDGGGSPILDSPEIFFLIIQNCRWLGLGVSSWLLFVVFLAPHSFPSTFSVSQLPQLLLPIPTAINCKLPWALSCKLGEVEVKQKHMYLYSIWLG